MATIDADDASTSCKPFSKNRSGMVLEPSDHAKARGAHVHGEILGYVASNDAGHITRPSVEGQADAIQVALRSAGIEASAINAINAINAHGTGTYTNDATETGDIKAVFGHRTYDIPISAKKAPHGHLLGTTGALKCALSLLAMQHRVALPTMHLLRPDPACDLDYVPNAARHDVSANTVLSNSFSFGGTNAVLVLRRVC